MSKHRHSAEDLKDYRHQLFILKRAGLLKKATDVKKAKPGKRYDSLLKRFAGFLEGTRRLPDGRVEKVPPHLKSIKLTKRQIHRAKIDNREVYRGHAIVPVSDFYEVRKGKKDWYGYHLIGKDGIRLLEVAPPRGKDLEAYLLRLADAFPDVPGVHYQIGFDIYGHHSRTVFASWDLAINHIMRYVLVAGANEEDIITGITLYEIRTSIAKEYLKAGRKRKAKRGKRTK